MSRFFDIETLKKKVDLDKPSIFKSNLLKNPHIIFEYVTRYLNGNLYTGWAEYTSNQYTEGAPLQLLGNTDTILPNNQASIRDDEKPIDIDSFMDGNKFKGRWGDAYIVTLDFKAKPTNAGTLYLETWFDIGGAAPDLYKRIVSFPKGNGVERPITHTTGVFTLDTWQSNSADIYVRANNTCDVYDIRLIAYRLHKARNSYPLQVS